MLSMCSWIFLGQLPSVIGKSLEYLSALLLSPLWRWWEVWVTPLLNSERQSGCVPTVLVGTGAPLFVWRPKEPESEHLV